MSDKLRIKRERILLDKIEERDKGLSSRIDYLEDKLTLLLEAIKQLDEEVRSLKNPFSKQGRR